MFQNTGYLSLIGKTICLGSYIKNCISEKYDQVIMGHLKDQIATTVTHN